MKSLPSGQQAGRQQQHQALQIVARPQVRFLVTQRSTQLRRRQALNHRLGKHYPGPENAHQGEQRGRGLEHAQMGSRDSVKPAGRPSRMQSRV